MLKHPEVTLGRLHRFLRELTELLYPESEPLTELAVFSAPGRISYEEAMAGSYRPASEGDIFSPRWSTHWFRVGYKVPATWEGREVLLQFHSSSEGCVWKDGVPLQGLTSYNWGLQDIRSHFPLLSQAAGGEAGTLYVEAAINGMFGFSNLGWKGSEPIGHLKHARLVTFDRAVWDLMWDFTILKEIAECLPADGPHQGKALAAANEIVNAVTLGEPETYPVGRAIAQKFFAATNGTRNHHLSAIGHAHIDTAWLWPIAETKRKCYRTFSTVIGLMDRHPEFQFACSQAQQLAWIKNDQPDLYAKIQQKVREGQFIPVGGTWIEPDCNMPSGESLVRQFLMGQRFFRREFGSYCGEFWNPDVFGYSGALPQIMRGAGIRFFLTQKLNLNQFNKPANSTFLWEGIDGSRVLTHFPPTDTYNSIVTVEEVLKHYGNFKNAERASESYMLFGYGDGGGGPTEEMLERLHRLKNVAGLPEVEIRSPQDFFERCEADLQDPLVWSGELYFELHRGTYTTQAANKRDNRRCEELLHDIEFLNVLTFQLNGAPYPREEINHLWEVVLLNQFHDIIPGSSITEVYEDSARDYAEVLASGKNLRDRAVTALLPGGRGPNIVGVNSLCWPRREIVEMPDGSGPVVVEAPAYGYTIQMPQREDEKTVSASRTPDGMVLENEMVRASLDPQGRLLSFFDKRHQREILASVGNQFVLFEDKPILEDAWNVEVYHLEKRKEVGTAIRDLVLESGPLRASVEVTVELSAKASLKQRISLDAISPRLNFETSVDWQESDQFLKVEFPLALRSDHATYEIQFGHLQRPTHFNTSWDVARFETCAHRWADLSEPSFGVALLNDSKYGYSCRGNILSLSLLRSPKTPDPMADMGRHHFRYALFPHAFGPQLGEVIQEAALFNQPLALISTALPPQTKSFFAMDNPAVILDTVKLAEESDDIILRFYEAHGGHQTATLTTSLPFSKVVRVNLLEDGEEFVSNEKGEIPLSLRPFEILSLKLVSSGRCS